MNVLRQLHAPPPHPRAPLFMFPPITGETSCYEEVAREIDDRAVFALELARDDDPPTTAEALARCCLADIVTAAAGAPILLFGWSAGGVIAYEAARQARDAGIEIAGVALLEVRAPSDVMVDGTPGATDLAEMATILPLSRRLAYLVGEPPAYMQAELAAMSADERIAAVHREAVRTEFLPAGADPIATRRLVSTFQWIGRAAMSYRPVPYPGHVTLFEATSELAEHPRPPTLGWERFVADLSHVPVDGNVFTVLQPARRQALGRALLAWAQGR